MNWIVTCPNCATEHQVTKTEVTVHCGIVECRCTCENCSQKYRKRIEYWRWMGLSEAPEDLIVKA